MTTARAGAATRSRRAPSIAPVRIAIGVVTGLLLAIAAWYAADLLRYYDGRGEVGMDWAFYVGLGQRWLDTGVIYGARQLAGEPYHVLVNVDDLYPPTAILFFAAFAVLPPAISAAVWWIVPLAVVIGVLVHLRPRRWSWPLLAVAIAWPRTLGSVIVGNSDLWSAAFVAGGLVWGWPGALGAIKPAFAPFALVGARRRSWWIAAVAIGAASVPFVLGGDAADYVTAATHWDLPWHRSVPNLPLVLLPAIAWLGRSRDAGDGTLTP